MRHVAIIACDHGLGHVRRCYLLARELLSLRHKVDLYAPADKVARIRAVLGRTDGLHTVDFATQTSPAALQAGSQTALRWHHRLPDIDSYDLVVCDTLPEILERRPDAVLLAQFFWHDVLTGLPTAYVDNCLRLLNDTHPSIFGSDLFAMPVVRNQPRFTPVGLYGPGGPRPNLTQRRYSLLITPGSTPLARDVHQVLVANMVERGTHPFTRVYVDPAVLPLDTPDWMRAADFRQDAYHDVRAVVCRPGLGVLTDTLWSGAIPVCLGMGTNPEMQHNAAMIAAQQLGYSCDGAMHALWLLDRLMVERPKHPRLASSEFTAAGTVALSLNCERKLPEEL